MQNSKIKIKSENKIDYIRVSVTDRCNLRCFYCMPPSGLPLIPRGDILSFEEIGKLIKIFADLGIAHIRITGGEPLVRKGLEELIGSISKIDGIRDISITTNGVLLPLYAERLKRAGLGRVNISLDTLKEEKFKILTNQNAFGDVLAGIEKAISVGFKPIKLNMVVMKGINDDEINSFADFALDRGLILRFIEFMQITPLWRSDYFMPIEAVLQIVEKRFGLKKIEVNGCGPARYYAVDGRGLLGFIKTDEENCRRCGRLRLTCTGELKICLFEQSSLSLKSLLRDGREEEELRSIIKSRLKIKENVSWKNWEFNQAFMNQIGG